MADFCLKFAEEREKIQILAEDLKPDRTWFKLAPLLRDVRNNKLFKEWDCENFTDYCEKDLFFGRSAASDIIGRKQKQKGGDRRSERDS